MKRISTIFLLVAMICLSSLAVSAQSPRDRKQFRDDIREYKHNYLKQKLDLSREQATSFFDIYDKMDDAITELNDEARTVETKIFEAPDGTITDIEYEVATRTLLEVKEKEAAIEKEYYDRFKEILTPRQLFELRRVERDFTMQLIKYHHNKKAKKK